MDVDSCPECVSGEKGCAGNGTLVCDQPYECSGEGVAGTDYQETEEICQQVVEGGGGGEGEKMGKKIKIIDVFIHTSFFV